MKIWYARIDSEVSAWERTGGRRKRIKTRWTNKLGKPEMNSDSGIILVRGALSAERTKDGSAGLGRGARYILTAYTVTF